jgi:hypothetical protein
MSNFDGCKNEKCLSKCEAHTRETHLRMPTGQGIATVRHSYHGHLDTNA